MLPHSSCRTSLSGFLAATFINSYFRGVMNMKKLLIVAMVLVLAVSCSTRLPYKDAGLVGNVIEKDYEVLGPVSVSGTGEHLCG